MMFMMWEVLIAVRPIRPSVRASPFRQRTTLCRGGAANTLVRFAEIGLIE